MDVNCFLFDLATFNLLLDVAKTTGTSQRLLTYEIMQEMEYLGTSELLWGIR